jgi:hypothetical protein
VRRGRVGVFHDERTRSTPLDPNLMFWCVSYHLGAFGTVWLPYKTRCKTGRTSSKVSATKLRRSFSRWTHPIHPHWTLNYRFAAFRNIWVHLGPFGCLTKLGAKRAELVQKFMPRSCVGVFRNELFSQRTIARSRNAKHTNATSCNSLCNSSLRKIPMRLRGTNLH